VLPDDRQPTTSLRVVAPICSSYEAFRKQADAPRRHRLDRVEFCAEPGEVSIALRCDMTTSTSLRAKRSNPFFLLRGAMDCFAALAMTAETTSHSLTRMRPKFCKKPYPPRTGRRKTGCAAAPRVSRAIDARDRTRAYRFAETLRPSPQWLYGYFVLAPVTAFCTVISGYALDPFGSISNHTT